MTKLANQNNGKPRTPQPRTGQTATVPIYDADGNIVGYQPVNGRMNGGAPCGPMPATQPQSWGAACPPGHCTSDQLAASLNRGFAGERYGCRELTYWIPIQLDGAGDGTFTGNAAVTICPTRIVAYGVAAGVEVNAGQLSVFRVGNQNQIVGAPLPLIMLHPASYQIIPFVTDCLKAGTPFTMTITGGDDDATWILGLVGPAIG